MTTQTSTGLGGFLTRRRGGARLDFTDLATYIYLMLGTVLMFGPVVWLVLSSFKPTANLYEFPPTLLPYDSPTVTLPGYDQPLGLYDVKMADGSVKRLAEISQIGIGARMIDPQTPTADPIDVKVSQLTAVRNVHWAFENYTGAIKNFPFLTYLGNSTLVTVVATLITLLINSMAAFGLSKYQFRGRDAIFLVILSTLMVPVSVILIPAFLVLAKVGLTNNLWGLIIPGAATPTGVFLLRQYMLTIPDDLLQSARIDGASEWRIYWTIVLPVLKPILVTMATFSFLSAWNDFMWPLIVLSDSSQYTLPVALANLVGEHVQDTELMMAGSVLTVLPVLGVFLVMQRSYIKGVLMGSVKG